MLQFCRRCDRRVLPNSDGACPGCRQSDALVDAELAHVRVEKCQKRITLRGHQEFPGICAHCGGVATDGRVLTWTRKSPHTQGDQSLLTWLILFGLMGALVARLLGRSEQVISLRLPHCRECAKCQLEVTDVDWENYRVVAWCHERFAEELTKHPRKWD